MIYEKSVCLIDRYEYVNKIGSGAYCEVVLVRHKATQRFFAMKIVDLVFDNILDTKNILKEIVVLRHMSKNKHFPKIKEIFVDEGETLGKFPPFNTIYIVMEYMETDLRGYLLNSQIKDSDLLVNYFYQLVSSVFSLH